MFKWLKPKIEIPKVYKVSNTPCPCFDNDFDKCLHPEALRKIDYNAGYKDKLKMETFIDCSYKKYLAGTGLVQSVFTKKEYEHYLRINTYCWHPKELIEKQY